MRTPQKKSNIYFVLAITVFITVFLMPFFSLFVTYDRTARMQFVVYYLALIVPAGGLLLGFFVFQAIAWHLYAVTLESYAGIKADWPKGGYEAWYRQNRSRAVSALAHLYKDAATGNAAAKIMLRLLRKAIRKLELHKPLPNYD